LERGKPVESGEFRRWDGKLVYVTFAGENGSRVIPLDAGTEYFPASDYVTNGQLLPVGEPISDEEASPIASLKPRTGCIYTWDPRERGGVKVKLSPKGAPVPEPPKNVRVIRGSAVHSRVRVVNDQGKEEGHDFIVYTEHIRRPVIKSPTAATAPPDS
jgi:hypothetical protein